MIEGVNIKQLIANDTDKFETVKELKYEQQDLIHILNNIGIRTDPNIAKNDQMILYFILQGSTRKGLTSLKKMASRFDGIELEKLVNSNDSDIHSLLVVQDDKTNVFCHYAKVMAPIL